MSIDAHQHFWRLERGDYPWITPDLAAIHRDHGPEDLAPLLAAAGVKRTVLVQVAQTEAETDFLLGIAAETPFVAGVVGWTDLEAADGAQRAERMAARGGVLGLRPMIQDIPDDGWMLRPALAAPLEAMADTGLVLDALVAPRHLPNLARLLDANPDLKVVIDHGAKPDIAGGGLAGWAGWIRRIAADSGAVCKLSGLVTQAAPGWSVDDLRPYVEVLLESFGPRRLMWGSDWPVVNLNGSYGAWRAASETLLAGLTADERQAVFGGVAARVYGIGA